MPTVRLCGFRSREWLLHMVFDEACYNPTQTIRLLSHVFREASTCNRNITRLLRMQTVRLCCFFAVNDFQNFWTDADWRNMWESDSDNPPAFTCIQRSTRLRKEHHENPEKGSKAKVRDSSVAVEHDLSVGMGFVRCTQWRPAWTLFVHHLVSSLDRNRSCPEKKQMYPRRDLFSPCFARLESWCLLLESVEIIIKSSKKKQ